MKISVWDTYVKRDDGNVMHFDILVPSHITDESIIFNYGRKYLKRKSILNPIITAHECRFCHIEQATEAMKKEINAKGFFIIEMEHCN